LRSTLRTGPASPRRGCACRAGRGRRGK
jgi:hypothetical protein